VNYPADLSPTSAAQGNADLVNHVRSQAASCPNQRFVLVGYSQGANVVDNSIGISSAGAVVGSPIVATIPAALEPRVAAVLLFGNPIRAIGKSVTGVYQSRTMDFCAAGDPICESGGGDVGAHLSYRDDADAAAAFAAGRV
jgi:cutinase